jgi:apolipoprotein N-acyltransferase
LLLSIVRLHASGRATTLRATYRGFAAGLVYFAGTLYWLPDVMVTFGGLAYPLALLAALLLIAYLALYPAVFAAVVARGLTSAGHAALFAAPFVWVATEYVRGHALSGFPWVPLGNSQIDSTAIAQFASITGVYGLSGLVAAVPAGLVFGIVSTGRRRLAGIALTVVLVGGVALWGQQRVSAGRLTATGTPVRVGLAQGNVPQGQKWDPAHAGTIFSRYLAQSRDVASRGAQLIVWPESSTPFAFEQDPAAAEYIRRLARTTGASMLVGSDQVERTSPPRYFNSAFLVRSDGSVGGVYRKMHLVPFGEYVPFQRLLFFVSTIVESVGGFTPGETLTVFEAAGGSLSTAICYEVVFPELAREAVLRGSRLLSTITNDAWYGRSSAPFQHFEQARMRAIEQGRYLVRAANTGISGIVDPYGRVVAKTGLFEEAVLVGDVRFLDGLTVYARIGDFVPWGSLVLSALFVAPWSRWRRR